MRRNVHDWDYHMRLAPAGADVVHFRHFREWRDSGVAFEFRDATYPAPNRSMASYVRGQMARAPPHPPRPPCASADRR